MSEEKHSPANHAEVAAGVGAGTGADAGTGPSSTAGAGAVGAVPANPSVDAPAPDPDTFRPAPIKPAVPFSALEALDVRVGTILAVEEVAKSNKLVRLRVDFGDHQRAILSGLKKERPDPQVLVGLQALFVVNLEPRKMAGEVSEGMLFDLGYADGILPCLAMPERPVPPGTRAG
jgi:tRNA-binding protein